MKKNLFVLAIIFAISNFTSNHAYSFDNSNFKLKYNILELSTEIIEENYIVPDKEVYEQEMQFTYIPIPDYAKNAIYWPIKSLSWSLSSYYLIMEFIAPVVKDEKFRDYLYDSLFERWCHQYKPRTWQYSNGNYLPLCQRCTLMNVGIWMGHLDSFIWNAFEIPGWEKWQKRLLHIGIYSTLLLPMVFDGSLQAWSDDYTSNPTKRAITGFLFGYAITAISDEILQLILDK